MDREQGDRAGPRHGAPVMARCELKLLPGGGVVLVRVEEDRRPCRWCGTAQTALCDFPVRGARGATTCSAPMCQEHRHSVRPGADLDHCPDHIGKTPEA